MVQRTTLLRSIASTIADYRAGEIATPDADHVETWVEQFDADVRLPILLELDHVLKRTYCSKEHVVGVLSTLCALAELAGPSPEGFWRSANFLDIQSAGASQTEMLELFSDCLHDEFGFGTDDCGSTNGPHVYLDDGVFSGNRIINDLRKWIPSAPASVTLHVIVTALHLSGHWYSEKNVKEAFQAAGKAITFKWWRVIELEDRKKYIDTSDVLRPRTLPADALVQQYAAGLQYTPILRTGTGLGANNVFSSVAGRDTLEQEFLKAGARIRSICPYLGPYMRPLGNMVLQTLGFGSTFVTYRNCPNNCPLAFWAGDPWYPLFARKTN